jgi:hypothetical protein
MGTVYPALTLSGRRNDNEDLQPKGMHMKRFVFLVAVFLASAWAQAAGLPFAVESLKKAKELSAQDPSKHVLVFYTSEN